MNTEKNANQIREMYAELGINIDKLGCIMLDLDGSPIQMAINDNDLFFTSHPERFWIKGFVAGHTPHVTLLYGLLKSGNTEYRQYVDKVLEGWKIETVSVDHVGYFESPYPDEPYYCIVAHLNISNTLKAGHNRLQLLPHINTFPDYKAHITIAYVKKDEVIRDHVIEVYNEMLQNIQLNVTNINYGK